MELILIRHGECIVDAAHPLFDPMDPPLTDRGWRQARMAAERLAASPVDLLFCGPLLRNLQTAQCVYEGTSIRPRLLWELFEVGYNHVTRQRTSIEHEFPFAEMGDACKWPTSPVENRKDAFVRATGLWRRLRDTYQATDVRLGVVSHGTFNDLFLSVVLDLPLSPDIRFNSGNCSFHRIERKQDAFRILCINDETHIPLTERS